MYYIVLLYLTLKKTEIFSFRTTLQNLNYLRLIAESDDRTPSYILNKKIERYSANRDNTINFTKLLSNNSVSYSNYQMINSVRIFEQIGYDFQILVDILLNNLFLKTANREIAFNIIYSHNINFDLIGKLISFSKKDSYKKLFTKRKKFKIMEEYSKYVLRNGSSYA